MYVYIVVGRPLGAIVLLSALQPVDIMETKEVLSHTHCEFLSAWEGKYIYTVSGGKCTGSMSIIIM